MYVEIKQFSKVDINQNNISTAILLITGKFLNEIQAICSSVVYRYIFAYIIKFVFYLIFNHIFVCINHKDTCTFQSDDK